MPYNTTAIPPRKEVTGQTLLPLTRVKKIIAVDPDITVCSNNAAFVITLATELFIQHLATEAQNMAKAERKPRRNVQYKDIANAVSHHDNLEFLEDIVPKTATYKQIKGQASATREKLQRENAAAAEGGAGGAAGATTGEELSNGKKAKVGVNGAASDAATAEAVPTNGVSRGRSSFGDDPNSQLEMEMRQAHQSQDNGDVDMTG